MQDLSRLFIASPDSSLLYAGYYDPVLVGLSVAVAIFASYASILVSGHVARVSVAAIRRLWLAAGGLCLGLGIWAMHFSGMLALNLPCATGYDVSLTLLSMIPSVLACSLALRIISRPVISLAQLLAGGLLLGGGIGTMHYTGMAAVRLEGLIRYDAKLFVLSWVVAVLLATGAIWVKFRLQARGGRGATMGSALAIGLAVSGVHYIAMAAAYFLREGDGSIVDSQIGATLVATTVLVAASVIIVVTITATYVTRPKLLSWSQAYRMVGVVMIAWCWIAWLGAGYYYNRLIDNLYQGEFTNANKELNNVADLIQADLERLRGIPQVYAGQPEIRRALSSFGADVRPSSLDYRVRKHRWTQDAALASVNRVLATAAAPLQSDVIWVLNAAGDCVASSNHDQTDSFVGSNYSAREYFRQARRGQLGRQYALGLISKLAGLYYSYPVTHNGQFIGAVIVKRNVSNFLRWFESAQAFMTDANGVVILAADKQLEFRTMPGAAALGLRRPEKELQYGQVALTPLNIAATDEELPVSAFRFENHPVPTILVSRGVAEKMITVHVARPLTNIVHLQTEKVWLFGLLAAVGSTLVIAVSAVVLYLRESRRRALDLRIAATAFQTQEGMMITDGNGVILRVNQAFSELSGYSAAELVGQTPRLLKSGRHDAAFYAAMWETLARTGAWQGEVWDRRKDGTVYPEWLTITAVRDTSGEISHFVATHADITQRKAAEEEIARLAFFDSLTGLPNRRLLLDRLQQALASSARSKRHGALLFIDLDNFKTLNDTRGHDTGDQLLKEVAVRLTTCVREGDTVARLGGDEFVLMLEELSGNASEAAAQAKSVGEKILAVLNQLYRLADHDYHSTPSIGITLFADHRDTVDELMKRADMAMYQAKAMGRNTLRFFDPDMQAAVNARAVLEADLREAIRTSQFVLYYQIQVDDRGHPIGAEALLRWQHPHKGLLSPLSFISLAEDTGLILPLGQWVLERACRQLLAWAQSPDTAHLTLAVNVSQRQFHEPDFVAAVRALLSRTGANPRRLKLELTESQLIDDIEGTIAKMEELKALGIGFALDDFGTGYSSLAYLKRLPLDQLKIDRTFVRDIFTDSNDVAIIRTIVALGQSLGLDVIAEGVETEAQHTFLMQQGCHAYQGYLFGAPVPVHSLRLSSSTTGA